MRLQFLLETLNHYFKFFIFLVTNTIRSIPLPFIFHLNLWRRVFFYVIILSLLVLILLLCFTFFSFFLGRNWLYYLHKSISAQVLKLLRLIIRTDLLITIHFFLHSSLAIATFLSWELLLLWFLALLILATILKVIRAVGFAPFILPFLWHPVLPVEVVYLCVVLFEVIVVVVKNFLLRLLNDLINII